MSVLADSLRKTFQEQSGENKSDARFLFGTTYSSTYNPPPTHAYTNRSPLPVSASQQEQHALASHLISRSSIFPRLHSDPTVVKNKLVPHLNALLDACKTRDPSGSGIISEPQLAECVKATVFLTNAEQEMLLNLAQPCYVPEHQYNYQQLADLLLGKSVQDAAGVSLGRPPLPPLVEWPADQDFTVTLRHRSATQPYTFPAVRMAEFAKVATRLCKEEVDCEKVHALLRTHLLNELVVSPGPVGRPDLSFTQWLAGQSVMSLTVRQRPGPIPPEVYDVLDQIVYDAFGLPKAMSPTQTLTALGASLRRPELL